MNDLKQKLLDRHMSQDSIHDREMLRQLIDVVMQQREALLEMKCAKWIRWNGSGDYESLHDDDECLKCKALAATDEALKKKSGIE